MTMYDSGNNQRYNSWLETLGAPPGTEFHHNLREFTPHQNEWGAPDWNAFIQLSMYSYSSTHRYIHAKSNENRNTNTQENKDALFFFQEKDRLMAVAAIFGIESIPISESILSTILDAHNDFVASMDTLTEIVSLSRCLSVPIMDLLLDNIFSQGQGSNVSSSSSGMKLLTAAIKHKRITAIGCIVRRFSGWRHWRDAMGMTPLHIVFGYENDNENDGEQGGDLITKRSDILELLLSNLHLGGHDRTCTRNDGNISEDEDRKNNSISCNGLLLNCREGVRTSLSTPMDCAIYYLHYKHRRSIECEDEWKCLHLCVEAAGLGTGEGGASSPFHILHYCISLELLQVRDLLFAEIIRRFGVDLDSTDDKGRTPMALAIINKKVAFVKQLLAMKLDIAATALPCYLDNNEEEIKSRFPLHLALESGIEWTGVEMIMDGYRSAIRIPDPVTGLYPFMLSASAQRENSRLDDTYSLLLSDPNVLSHRGSDKNRMGFLSIYMDRHGGAASLLLMSIAAAIASILWNWNSTNIYAPSRYIDLVYTSSTSSA
mmetsp:Transcript_17625/g.26693  ORF Transcript_17625/g.26693 Transcript_17625/m.26693 type:complete len:544 (+) Transcript_17625:47-1678(+)